MRISSGAVAAVIVATVTATATSGLAYARPAPVGSPATRIPTLRVVGYGAVQHPHTQTYTASSRDPRTGMCSTLVADGDGSAPGPLLVEPGTEKLRITLHTTRRPVRHSIDIFGEPLIDHPNQKPVHPGSHLAKVDNRAGHPVWQVRTTLQLGAGQAAYLSLHIAWKNQCKGTDDASWTFHVEAAS